jgi:hypothetical protein
MAMRYEGCAFVAGFGVATACGRDDGRGGVNRHAGAGQVERARPVAPTSMARSQARRMLAAQSAQGEWRSLMVA